MHQGGKEYFMRAHFGLPSVVSEETEGKPPIQLKFEIPYFTVSGIQVNIFPSLVPNPFQFKQFFVSPFKGSLFENY